MASTGTAADAGYVSDAVTAINTSLGLRPKTIKMNGSTKTVASSTVDLGQVVTSVTDSTGTAVVMSGGVLQLPASVGTLQSSSTLTNLYSSPFTTNTIARWQSWDTTKLPISWDSTTGNTAAGSMKIAALAGANSAILGFDSVAVTVGDTIRFSAWHNIPSGTTMSWQPKWLDSSGTRFDAVSNATMTGTGAWTKVSIDLTVPSNAAKCLVIISNTGALASAVNMWIDDISFDKVVTTTSWTGGGSVTTATTNYASTITN